MRDRKNPTRRTLFFYLFFSSLSPSRSLYLNLSPLPIPALFWIRIQFCQSSRSSIFLFFLPSSLGLLSFPFFSLKFGSWSMFSLVHSICLPLAIVMLKEKLIFKIFFLQIVLSVALSFSLLSLFVHMLVRGRVWGSERVNGGVCCQESCVPTCNIFLSTPSPPPPAPS